MMDSYTNREQAAVIVVFLAMCLEVFLYDYAAENLGDKYIKEHLDKLDLKSKYVLFTKLVTGKDIDKSQEAYAKIIELSRLRNELVHFKSKTFKHAEDIHYKFSDKLAKGVVDSINVVILVMQELDELHGCKAYSKNLNW